MTDNKQHVGVPMAAPMQNVGGAVAPAPRHLGDVVEFARVMASARGAIPQAFVNNVGACAALTMSALRFGLDPFAVAQKAYMVNGVIAYEAQLIMALLNTRAPIKGRLRYHYTGEGGDRRCTVKAVLADGSGEVEYATPPLRQIAGKSPLWKRDPDQQLAYFAARSLARRYFPEVILGVYSVDEMQDGRTMDDAGEHIDADAAVVNDEIVQNTEGNPLLDGGDDGGDVDFDGDDVVDVDVDDVADDDAPDFDEETGEIMEDDDAPEPEQNPAEQLIETLIKSLTGITDVQALNVVWKQHEASINHMKESMPELYERLKSAFGARKNEILGR